MVDYFTALQVEIDVAGEESIEVMESGLEEVVGEAQAAASDDSALALLADITSKYQQEEPTIQVIKKEKHVRDTLNFVGVIIFCVKVIATIYLCSTGCSVSGGNCNSLQGSGQCRVC